MKMIIKAPAKLNLGLDATSVHSNKEVEWEMVMTSISLCDYVTLETNSSGKIEIDTDSGFLPDDGRNLALKAARLFFQDNHISSGLKISIEKNIPVAAGLGGGSSDAAAVLRGLNTMFRTGKTLFELAKLGLQIDSDVPYCVYGKTAKVSGYGEVITPLPKLPSMWFVLAKPNVSVSTPKIIRSLHNVELDHPNINGLVSAVESQNYEEIVGNLANTLETVTSKMYPQILTIKQRLQKYGADGSLMTGSGPTVYGICRKQSRANRVFNSISGFCHEVYIARSIETN
ncbi:4-(cytidine 5'-diphospho)-2-C-methyl-D-erythritol kinase [Lentilactobacillus curieae]|uniref:4-diphosphocytidyl-2-C-methyl-D-erythritol kinase n=1 Tax=Lentilactobacillus curieae TaxID=1138822 RepID=A0A1S6QJD6_9LACO|nr:4-(cytidine 5'-diphospho)-2-C-methyl-D-erythritol kinase [Lentilactobacillus curieae]AQW21706.1 4-(cytidine 5'-diphospho)-2-C-methyl-D-erythritol kinase [Lentilactobacillus curieae]